MRESHNLLNIHIKITNIFNRSQFNKPNYFLQLWKKHFVNFNLCLNDFADVSLENPKSS